MRKEPYLIDMSGVPLLLRGGRVVNEDEMIYADVLIYDGLIQLVFFKYVFLQI